MLSHSSNPRSSIQAAAVPSSSKQPALPTVGSHYRDSAAAQDHSRATRALPYRPAHQLELLNLHAELDALQQHLNVAHEKQSRELIHQ
ncbi:MAG: hypothetical protein WBA10_02630 [Elainellaceae cyanobacterium]